MASSTSQLSTCHRLHRCQRDRFQSVLRHEVYCAGSLYLFGDKGGADSGDERSRNGSGEESIVRRSGALVFGGGRASQDARHCRARHGRGRPYPLERSRHHADPGPGEFSLRPRPQVAVIGISAVSETGPVLRRTGGEDRRGSPLISKQPSARPNRRSRPPTTCCARPRSTRNNCGSTGYR